MAPGGPVEPAFAPRYTIASDCAPQRRENTLFVDQNQLIFAGVMYACLLFSLSVHEAAHAWTAERCGDPTARHLGRVTLNPLVHMDFIGTLVLPLFMLMSGSGFLFGWAKPVPFNPINLNNMRADPVKIAVAGPASNLLIAVTALFGTKAFLMASPESAPLILPLMLPLIIINLILMVFNMIPVPPLDGHYILRMFLSEKGKAVLDNAGIFGILIAILILNFVLIGPIGAGIQALVDFLVPADS